MKTLLIIQSRMESKRLPNKSLFPINKIPLVVLVAKRVKSKKYKTIVATTTRESDDDLCKILKKNKINFFRGSSNNVRKRFLECSKNYSDEDIIVRLTADNCFPDNRLVESVLSEIDDKTKYIFINNKISKVPYGLSVEAFKLGYLRNIKNKDSNSIEHVTWNFKKGKQYNYLSKINMGNLRCTIDTVDDYLQVAKAFKNVNNPIKISWKKLCKNLYNNNLKKNNFKLELGKKLILGCAQLGFKYGITNSKKMSRDEAKKIMLFCDKIGINNFDTASSYGESEKIIGKFLKVSNKRKIDTKIYLDLKNLSSKMITNSFKHKIKNSYKYLKGDINTYYLHNISQNNEKFNILMKNLNFYHNEKFFLNRGISFDDYKDYKFFFKNYKKIETIQLPFNILDNRWFCDLDKIKRKNIRIVVRSIFLQGILTSKITKWPKNIKTFKKNLLNKMELLIRRYNRLSLMDLCIAYVNSLKKIDKIIIGVNSFKQLTKLFYLFNLKPLTSKESLDLRKNFSQVNIKVIQPSKWKI